MKTPELIRTRLTQGEWVSSIDLLDPYLPIPFHPAQGHSFGLPTRANLSIHRSSLRASHSPTGLHNDHKKAKLMDLSRGIRLHQYQDDWLTRAPSQREALLNTNTIVNLISSFVLWLGHQPRKVSIDSYSREVFSLVGYK